MKRSLRRALEAVDVLLVLAGAERGDDQRLRLAAGEQRRAVGARQDVHFRQDRTHRLQIAAIDALAGPHDVAADDVDLELLEHSAEQDLLVGAWHRPGAAASLSPWRRQPCRWRFCFCGVANAARKSASTSACTLVAYFDLSGGVKSNGSLAAFSASLMIAWITGCAFLWPNITASSICVSGKLVRLALDHHHGILRAGDDQVELGLGHLVDERIEHELAVDEADAGGADRTEERHARQRQRGGGRDHATMSGSFSLSNDITVTMTWISFLNPSTNSGTDRTVDQARGQRLLLGRAAFALEVAAGDLAGRVGVLLVVHGKREEIDPGLRALRGDHGGENTRLAVLRDHGASAWRAMWPVSSLSLRPPHSISTRWMSNMRFVFRSVTSNWRRSPADRGSTQTAPEPRLTGASAVDMLASQCKSGAHRPRLPRTQRGRCEDCRHAISGGCRACR